MWVYHVGYHVGLSCGFIMWVIMLLVMWVIMWVIMGVIMYELYDVTSIFSDIVCMLQVYHSMTPFCTDTHTSVTIRRMRTLVHQLATTYAIVYCVLCIVYVLACAHTTYDVHDQLYVSAYISSYVCMSVCLYVSLSSSIQHSCSSQLLLTIYLLACRLL